MNIQTETQGGIGYIDAYPPMSTYKEELTTYRYRSIDGHCWAISPGGKTYYAGEEDELMAKLEGENTRL